MKRFLPCRLIIWLGAIFSLFFLFFVIYPVAYAGVVPVPGGRPIPEGMLGNPGKFFPVYLQDNSLKILKDQGFFAFDDFDHHRPEIEKKVGLHVKYAKVGINIPRRCFWVTYNFWEKRDALRKILPESLIRSLIDMTVKGKNDEMGGVLCLRDMKTGIYYLGFGVFTDRKEFTTDNTVTGRNTFKDYVALKKTTPQVVEVFKEALQWIIAHKKELTRTYWNPIGKKLVEKRNAKL